MKITICGSITFLEEMKKHKEELEKLGFDEVYIPKGFEDKDFSDKELKDKSNNVEDANRKIDHDLIRRHFYLILKSDCVFIANYTKKGIENYIGGNTFLEMGYAFVMGKPIFVLNPLPELKYISEMEGMQPIILNGQLNGIVDYYSFNN